MMLERQLGVPPQWGYPARFLLTALVYLLVSRRTICFRFASPMGSIALGVFVFLVWVGPDLLFGPAYRHQWIFENAVFGAAASSAPAALKSNPFFITFRLLGAIALVPVIEELFWRGWLIRWLAHHEFWKVCIGSYSPAAFWTVALLFGSEHGPYWEVGILAGIAYNWWVIRTRSLADCALAHAVTNAMLCAYVLLTGRWQYWL
jgi:CAAX prenyl protease-like protein